MFKRGHFRILVGIEEFQYTEVSSFREVGIEVYLVSGGWDRRVSYIPKE